MRRAALGSARAVSVARLSGTGNGSPAVTSVATPHRAHARPRARRTGCLPTPVRSSAGRAAGTSDRAAARTADGGRPARAARAVQRSTDPAGKPGRELDGAGPAAPTGREECTDGPAFEPAEREREDADGALVDPLDVVDGEQERRFAGESRIRPRVATERVRWSAAAPSGSARRSATSSARRWGGGKSREQLRSERSRRDRRRRRAGAARPIAPAAKTGCESHDAARPLGRPARARSFRCRLLPRGKAQRSRWQRARACLRPRRAPRRAR